MKASQIAVSFFPGEETHSENLMTVNLLVCVTVCGVCARQRNESDRKKEKK